MKIDLRSFFRIRSVEKDSSTINDKLEHDKKPSDPEESG